MDAPIIASLIGLAGLVGINILATIFNWGKNTGNINARLNAVEERIVEEHVRALQDSERDKESRLEWEHRMETFVLPECRRVFNEINDDLAELKGQQAAVLRILEKALNHPNRKD